MAEETQFGENPAGRPPHAGRMQPEGVLLLNERDERAIGWQWRESSK